MLCDTRIMRAEDACTVFVTLPVRWLIKYNLGRDGSS